jgi:hypothetical protein
LKANFVASRVLGTRAMGALITEIAESTSEFELAHSLMNK